MTTDDLREWIALQRTPGISRASLRTLLQHCSDPRQLRTLSPRLMAQWGLTARAVETLGRGPDSQALRVADRDCLYIEQHNIHCLTLCCPDYPPLLLETADPPPLLYVCGDVAALHLPQIAVVGSRRCSRQGADNAYGLSRELAGGGVVITSGCALGIDGAAHRGALSVEGGRSIGVLGTGLDIVYPRQHRELFSLLPQRGALVSEFPLGTRPNRSLFPQRNRLISGLSLGVLVVEAALQSGSLITARLALEQNRDVFAVPGSIHSPASAGCHYLIQQGAQLVTCADDIAGAWEAWQPGRQGSLFSAVRAEVGDHLSPGISEPEGALLVAMGFDPASFDQLLERSGLAVQALQSLLTALELRGAIEQCGGVYQRRVCSVEETD